MSIRGRQERMDFVDTYTVGEASHEVVDGACWCLWQPAGGQRSIGGR